MVVKFDNVEKIFGFEYDLAHFSFLYSFNGEVHRVNDLCIRLYSDDECCYWCITDFDKIGQYRCYKTFNGFIRYIARQFNLSFETVLFSCNYKIIAHKNALEVLK